MASILKITDVLEEKGNDDLLVKGCIDRDRQSQNLLYEKFASKMLVVCMRFSKSREEAEDILMEGFMKVFNNIGDFKFEGSFEGWIRRIMVNTAIHKFRKKSNLHPVVNFEQIISSHYPETNDTLSLIHAKELLKVIQQLPPAYKMVFNLYSFEGMKHKEIAEQLGISEGTSKSNLSDARILLRRMIENNGKIAIAVNE